MEQSHHFVGSLGHVHQKSHAMARATFRWTVTVTSGQEASASYTIISDGYSQVSGE